MQGSRNTLFSALLALFLVQLSVVSVSHELQHLGEQLTRISVDVESNTATDHLDNSHCGTCTSLHFMAWIGAVSHAFSYEPLTKTLTIAPSPSKAGSLSDTLFLIRAPPALA